MAADQQPLQSTFGFKNKLEQQTSIGCWSATLAKMRRILMTTLVTATSEHFLGNVAWRQALQRSSRANAKTTPRSTAHLVTDQLFSTGAPYVSGSVLTQTAAKQSKADVCFA